MLFEKVCGFFFKLKSWNLGFLGQAQKKATHTQVYLEVTDAVLEHEVVPGDTIQDGHHRSHRVVQVLNLRNYFHNKSAIIFIT